MSKFPQELWDSYMRNDKKLKVPKGKRSFEDRKRELKKTQAWTQAIVVDHEYELEKIVHEYLQQKHDECTGSREMLAEFIKHEPYIRNQCRDRIKQYKEKCEAIREQQYKHTSTGKPYLLKLFDWYKENKASIADALRTSYGKAKLPLAVDQAIKKREAYEARRNKGGDSMTTAVRNEDRQMFIRTNKIKPGYAGKHHPFKFHQVTRKAKRVQQSDRARFALEQYKYTGRVSVTEPKAKREFIEWSNNNKHDKYAEPAIPGNPVPRCTSPIVEKESLDDIYEDLKKRKKQIVQKQFRSKSNAEGN